jgi:hypothetical protein
MTQSPRRRRQPAFAATLALSITSMLAGLLATPLPAAAHGDEMRLAPAVQARLAEARRATARFHHFAAALAAGYGPQPVIDLQGQACIAQPGEGAMGIHFANGGLFNTLLDDRTPQAMIYEPQADGSLRLVGVEYLVFKAAWDGALAANPGLPARPMLFGRDYHLVGEPNRYGLPAFYALHAWLWQPNPHGLFADWNPNVSCP